MSNIEKLLFCIESLGRKTTWNIPCLNNNGSFEVEWQDGWRYRNRNVKTWIETSSGDLIPALIKNDVNLDLFKRDLEDIATANLIERIDFTPILQILKE